MLFNSITCKNVSRLDYKHTHFIDISPDKPVGFIYMFTFQSGIMCSTAVIGYQGRSVINEALKNISYEQMRNLLRVTARFISAHVRLPSISLTD